MISIWDRIVHGTAAGEEDLHNAFVGFLAKNTTRIKEEKT